MSNNKQSIDDFDLSEYEFVPIKRIYKDYWIVLAQNEEDYKNKINCIIRGDRNGFLTINRAKRQ